MNPNPHVLALHGDVAYGAVRVAQDTRHALATADVERAEVHEAEVVNELTHGLVELGVAAREGAILLRDRGSGKGYG